MITKNILAASIATFLFAFATHAQIIQDGMFKNLTLDFETKQMNLWPLKNCDVRTDPIALRIRPVDTTQLTDNPFMHSAVYFNLATNFNYKNKYIIELNTYFEQRGWSYGINNVHNMIVFPEFKFLLKDTLRIKKEQVSLGLELGNFSPYTETNDLRFYNVDFNGIDFRVGWRFLELQFFNIGDMAWGVGTNVEELYRLQLSYIQNTARGNKIKAGTYFDITNYLIFNGPYNDLHSLIGKNNYKSYGLFFNYGYNDKNEIIFRGVYVGRNYSTNGNNNEVYRNMAAMLTFPVYCKWRSMDFRFVPSIKFYGSFFNYRHATPNILYRDKNSFTGYQNTVGEYLYPLRNYYRPVSQWALYTEYWMRNVLSFETQISFRHNIYRKLKGKGIIEAIFINSGWKTFTDSYFYTFYNYSVYVELVKQINLGVCLTNKMMNLDMHYHGFYMAKYPFVGCYFVKELGSKM